MPGPPEPEGTGNWPGCVREGTVLLRNGWRTPSFTRGLGILRICGGPGTPGRPRGTWRPRKTTSRPGDWKRKP
eukprot:13490365-Heterocapsa_arctica.AAC.1